MSDQAKRTFVCRNLQLFKRNDSKQEIQRT